MAHVHDLDDDAVAAVRAGDRARFRELVDRHAPEVFAVVRAFVRDGHRVEDLAQDTFRRAYERLAQFDAARGRFRTWLLAIARNRCRDELRRRPADALVLSTVATCEVRDPSPVDATSLDAALAALPPDQRMAFLLVHVFELAMDEVAQIEGVPTGTIKSRASRARARLRAVLKTGTRS